MADPLPCGDPVRTRREPAAQDGGMEHTPVIRRARVGDLPRLVELVLRFTLPVEADGS